MATKWYAPEVEAWLDSRHEMTEMLDWRADILPAQNRMRPSALMIVELLEERGWLQERLQNTARWYNPHVFKVADDGYIVRRPVFPDWMYQEGKQVWADSMDHGEGAWYEADGEYAFLPDHEQIEVGGRQPIGQPRV